LASKTKYAVEIFRDLEERGYGKYMEQDSEQGGWKTCVFKVFEGSKNGDCHSD
jgi:hypothetical protein